MTRARDLPGDPLIRSLVQQARRSQRGAVSRRTVLAGAGVAGVGSLLAACGTGGTSGGTSSSAAPGTDVSATDPTVSWANWTLYLDYDDESQSYPTLDAFAAETGITANYAEDIDDNDTYFGKIQGQLAIGQDIGQDIVVFTDWMAARMIRLGYTQELDRTNIPNASNLLASLQEVDFDPGRKHSLTWQSGFGGLAWSKEKIPGGLTSVSDLWKPEYKGRVEVLSEMRDTIGLIMLDQGVDISGDWGDDEFDAALAVVTEQIASGQIRQVKGNSYKEDLISGDAVAVIGWSGDITQINFEYDDQWSFLLPEAGGTLWSDNMEIPIGATHKANAEALMNYYYDPVVAAQVAAYVNFICPVDGAQDAMADIDPSLVENPLIFPDAATLAQAHVFRSLSAEEETKYNGAYLTAVGA
ncbi:polyamine ABC transporter substrate-binding protein [Pengzhenrongella sicca]|uniref:Spermidine/putrescine ABC transporter substrate-binding protein n=1 Tax=Pengzhenrongella sicca TaxID=2819238 RepID=A0A8A4ZGQ4_9MICO|nr:spermidine/putrescine ABC transporter substrate-binding protein [Pengzhenrongella sicca]QTE30571.1 spermidine/putrescine ABC transporter substrate-binding protein [Pengzhenrongella sicca]